MCRLLGVVSRRHTPLLEAVRDELPLFTALSEKHKDGWGVAWYAPGTAGEEHGLRRETADARSGLQVRRGIDTARASNEYGQAVADADGEIVIAHLRRASEGLVLSLENTHPFTEGPVAFAHNGQFDMPDGFRERVLTLGGRPAAGTTDSELYFSLIVLHAREHGWARAIQMAAHEITQWVPEMGGRYPEGLNCLLMTPDALVAYAQSDPEQLLPESTWDVYDLMHREDADRVLVGSTGYDQPGFSALEQGHALTIHRGTLEVEAHEPIDGFVLAPARAEGEAAWAARRPDAPGAQPSLALLGVGAAR